MQLLSAAVCCQQRQAQAEARTNLHWELLFSSPSLSLSLSVFALRSSTRFCPFCWGRSLVAADSPPLFWAPICRLLRCFWAQPEVPAGGAAVSDQVRGASRRTVNGRVAWSEKCRLDEERLAPQLCGPHVVWDRGKVARYRARLCTCLLRTLAGDSLRDGEVSSPLWPLSRPFRGPNVSPADRGLQGLCQASKESQSLAWRDWD